MVYQWSGFKYPVPAQTVGEELERLEAENGSVTKELVVDAARPESSVMHKLFEWDDQIAGERWRRQQAKSMLSCLHIVVEKETKEEEPQAISVRAYTNVSVDDSRTPARYVFTPKGISGDDKKTILDNAAREIEEFTRKYRAYEELAKVIAAMDEWSNRFKKAI